MQHSECAAYTTAWHQDQFALSVCMSVCVAGSLGVCAVSVCTDERAKTVGVAVPSHGQVSCTCVRDRCHIDSVWATSLPSSGRMQSDICTVHRYMTVAMDSPHPDALRPDAVASCCLPHTRHWTCQYPSPTACMPCIYLRFNHIRCLHLLRIHMQQDMLQADVSVVCVGVMQSCITLGFPDLD